MCSPVRAKAKANRGNRNAERKHGRAHRHMRRRDVSRLVAPDDPGAEGDLAQPGAGTRVRQARKPTRLPAVLTRQKQGGNYTCRDDHRDKTMSQLQPDLKRA